MTAETDPRLYLDQTLQPHRSLSAVGAVLLLAPVAVVNIVFAAVFLSMGAHFVPIFMGVDVLALMLAIWLSSRGSRTSERISVSADEVRVERGAGRSARLVWRSPTAFTRVELERPGRYGPRLRLAVRDRRLTVASALGPRRRREFARALEAAVRDARAERW
jgi:uncharacterized membrane protein